MTAVYSLLYFDDDALLATAVEHAIGYDLVVWCRPDVPWAPDGLQRDGVARRDEADVILARLVPRSSCRAGSAWSRCQGDVDHRVAAVRRAWQR